MEQNINTYAKHLRQNSTVAEKYLWYFLRSKRLHGFKFKRQHISSFICIERKLIIELDGGQHMSAMNYDAKRTDFLVKQRYRVIRFWNNEVLQKIDVVLQIILEALLENTSQKNI